MTWLQHHKVPTARWPHRSHPLPDVPPGLAKNINNGSYRGAESPNDVICFIKKHICDDELSQEPLLVLTEQRARNFDLIPQSKTLACTMDFFMLGHLYGLGLPCNRNIFSFNKLIRKKPFSKPIAVF